MKVIVILLVTIAMFCCSCNNSANNYTITKDDSSKIITAYLNSLKSEVVPANVVYANGRAGFGNIISTEDSKRYVERYKKNISSYDDRFSNSVWFDSSVVRFLGNYFDTTKRNVTGIRIYIAQYDKKIEGTNATVADQTSVIIVPTKPNKKPDWDAITAKTILFKGALNHGELCPQACDY